MLSEQLKEIFLKSKDPFTDILGQESAKQGIKSALLMNRHIIIVGAPGIGKTTLAKNVAKLLPDLEIVEGCSYHSLLQTQYVHHASKKQKTKLQNYKE